MTFDDMAMSKQRNRINSQHVTEKNIQALSRLFTNDFSKCVYGPMAY